MNIGLENGLEGVVDLVEMKAIYFDGDSGLIVRKEEIPENLKKTVKERKLELIAALAEVEPKFEDYFMEENINIPAKELKEVIRRHTIARTFCPVFMGSAFKTKGVQPLLDGVIDYLPNPKEVENIALDLSNNEEKVVMEIDNKKPFVGLAFKLEETQYGQLTWIRIYQGSIKKGATLLNSANGKKCKISRMVRMHAAKMEDISEAGAGDFFAFFGVDCASGETFCDVTKKYAMTSMHVPEPVMSLTIKPKKHADLDVFLKALTRF